mmetsp:Transcript_8378/g.26044  ORF Transcript_8378/g.26044 Transcript_8378/m.26044 type:complete len:88 (-) Transcript_8378:133-396(-)
MRTLCKVCVALLLLSVAEAGSFRLQSHGPPGPKDAVQCKTICHRFGMKALGQWKPEFSAIASPVVCADKCDEVFAAGSAQPAVPAQQ